MVVNTEVQNRSCVKYIQYFRRQRLTFSYILSGYINIIINTECYLQNVTELPQQPNKNKKHGNETFKELLGTCIK